MWDRAAAGRILTFRLSGLNHQNFLMSDEQTGSWWQQVSGECVLGPLKGALLRRVPSDEVTLATWRAEHPGSTIVRFDPRYRYPDSNWERRVAAISAPSAQPLPPRELVAGIEIDAAAVAFPVAALKERSPVNDRVGAAPVLLLAEGDSVRSFRRPVIEGSELEFFRRDGDRALIDSATGSVWAFSGRAVSGPLAGRQLEFVQNTKDYWFNWTRYHPEGILRRRL